MSSLKTYNINQVRHIDDEVDDEIPRTLVHRDIFPGTIVKHIFDVKSFGTVVSIYDDGGYTLVTIVWSIAPKESTYTMPQVRRVFPQMVAQQLVSVQPMTVPSGGVFYWDYKYELDSKKQARAKAAVNVKAKACIPQPPRSKVSQWHKQRNWKTRG